MKLRFEYVGVKVLYCLNWIFAALGIIIITSAIILQVHLEPIEKEFEVSYSYGPLTLGLIGTTFILLSITGYLGLKLHNSFILKIHRCILFSVLILELLCCGYLFTHMTETKHEIEAWMVLYFDQYDSKPSIQAVFDTMQRTMQCCGVLGAEDYETYLQRDSLPTSCCMPKFGKCSIADARFYSDGCSIVFFQHLKRQSIWIALIAFVHVIFTICSIFAVSVIMEESENCEEKIRFRGSSSGTRSCGCKTTTSTTTTNYSKLESVDEDN